ncbi:MAG: ferredoxin [Solirubrobacteraceae bacterium]
MAAVPVIDESACIAHGECEEMAPEAFRVEDAAVAIGTVSLERLVSIGEACPTTAISVIDEETGERLYP